MIDEHCVTPAKSGVHFTMEDSRPKPHRINTNPVDLPDEIMRYSLKMFYLNGNCVENNEPFAGH